MEELSLQESKTTTALNRENILIIVVLFLKNTIAGLFWVRCKSENWIQYCQEVYNLKTELGKTQKEVTYKLETTMS